MTNAHVAAFVSSVQRLQSQRDPKRVTLAERRFYSGNADGLRRYERLKRDPGFKALWDIRLGELRRAKRAGAALAVVWQDVIRNHYLQAHASPMHAKGVLVIYVPSQSAKYLMERELRAGAWTELQRAMPIAMSRYRVHVGQPPATGFQTPPSEPEAMSVYQVEDETEADDAAG